MNDKKTNTASLITVDASQYNLNANQAQIVKAAFDPMLQKMVDLEEEFNILTAKPVTPELIKEAHTLLQKYVKVRTGTAAIHAEQKKFYLQAGRFIDGWKNAQLMAGQGKEAKLQEIKDYYINIEKEKIRKLGEERASLLTEADPEATVPSSLGVMPEDEWSIYLTGVQETVRRRKEAQLQAERDRIAAEKKAEKEAAAAKKKAADEKKRLTKLAKDAQDRAARDRVRVDKLRPYMVLLRDGDLKKYQDMNDKAFSKALDLLFKEAEMSRKHEAEKHAARRKRDNNRERVIQKHAKRITNLPAMYECTDEKFNQIITRFEEQDKEDARKEADERRNEAARRIKQERANRDKIRIAAFKQYGVPTPGLLDADDDVFEAKLRELNIARIEKEETEKAKLAEQHHKDLQSGIDIVVGVVEEMHEVDAVRKGIAVPYATARDWANELQKYVDMKRKEN